MFVSFVNTIIIGVVGIGIYLSIHLVQRLSKGGEIPLGWWIFLPVVLSYALVLRIVQLLIYIGMISDPQNIIPAFYIVFYIGLVIFIYGLYSATCDLIKVRRDIL